jgi:peptidoglycan/LPS O-acetylase OafA/YrhL
MFDKEFQVHIQNSGSYETLDSAINTENESPLSIPTEPTTRVNADQKLLYLDGLRGILCLIVVFSHSLLMGKSIHDENFSIFFHPFMQHSPLRLLVAGEFGVAGFFVLSGCVLVRRYLEHSNETNILTSGLFRRFPRLFIPSTFALLLYFSILHFRPWYGFNECHQIGEGSVDPEKVGIGYVFLNTFGQYFWMPALYTIQWTMQVEYILSIIIYFLAFMVTRSWIHRYRMIFYAFLIFILPIIWLATHGQVPRLVQYIQPFVFGLLLSDFDANGFLTNFHSIKRHWSILINLSLILLTIYFGSYPVFNTDVVDGSGTLWSPFGWMFGWFWISFGGFCLILLSLLSKKMQYFLSTKPIHFLGKISFGVYLTHYVILCIMDTSFVKWTGPYLGRDLAVVLGLIFFALPSIFLVSYGFYLFVDAPAVQISYWLYYMMCKRCTKSKKRPNPIQRRIWISFLILLLISIIISSIPALQGYERCYNQTNQNLTLTLMIHEKLIKM